MPRHHPQHTASGVLILLPEGGTGLAVAEASLDRIGSDGRTGRERQAALEADLARLRAGVLPNETELQDAPVLHDWRLVIRAGEPLPSLTGILAGAHPHATPGRRIVTSMVAALDIQNRHWARTVSRFYVLGPPEGMRKS
ncbi:DUF6634 family protein [Microvirga massiliensis]|uniref:DUF6634 family protein n=1 Tax=Microvirga massiliensis TaxID=1033741 RepID=UPI00066019F7|nr:DUF6634 family protein [Microvirga massiliensis]